MKLKKYLREYFSYSASEKRGLLVLLLLLLLVFIVPQVVSSFKQETQLFNIDEQKRIDSLVTILQSSKGIKGKKKRAVRLTYFDPNKVSKKTLLELGFTNYQSSNLIRFRERGGKFYRKTDLLKIYGVDSVDLARLDTCIVIKSSKKKKRKKDVKSPQYKLNEFDPNTISVSEWQDLGVDKRISKRIKKYLATGAQFKEPNDLLNIYGLSKSKADELIPFVRIKPKDKIEEPVPILIDINTADTTEFKTIRGIGTVLASRIHKYRETLGGFHSLGQIKEVYGISEEKFEKISDFIMLDDIGVKEYGINSSNIEKLKMHPYVNFRLAKSIVRYRNKNGDFTSLDQLTEKQLVSDSLFRKLSPYLNLK